MNASKNGLKAVIIGAGVGGLTTGALLLRAGYDVTVLESGAYAGGCAGTFFHKGYRFDAGATLAGGFQPGGPHTQIASLLGIQWPVRQTNPAWIVHLPGKHIALGTTIHDVLTQFPASEAFWREQQRLADLAWSMAAAGLPWPPTSTTELLHLARVGMSHLPNDLQALPFAFGNVEGWMRRRGMVHNPDFVRFIDAQLLISAQTTSASANALYGATALDLPRQGVCEVRGGIGTIAQTLVDIIRNQGGRVLFKYTATRIDVENNRAVRVVTKSGRRDGETLPCDVVVANLTPWSLDALLDEHSPQSLRREVATRETGWGAYVLYLGVDASRLSADLPGHHQIITTREGPLGEGRSIFVSISPEWDETRAPTGHRAVTITTHTEVRQWWDLREQDRDSYEARKRTYADRMLAAVEEVIPGFRNSIVFTMNGTPVTYHSYTGRHLGMVGGFPQISLTRARGPRTGLRNVRLVGDSIFPGQSTAGVTLGAIRVARDILGGRLPEAPISQGVMAEVTGS